MITRNDVVRLLALCAAADQRTVADEDVTLWQGIGQMQRWTADSARRVVIEHYGQGADRPRITPAAISDRLRKLRSAAAESFEAPRIPDGLPNVQYPGWLRAQLARHVDGAVERWAVDGAEPSRAVPLAATGSLRELAAAAPDHVRAEIVAAARRLA